MQYEASRPGAQSSDAGSLSNRACSRADVIPWTNLTPAQAAAACAAAGARLCTETEWHTACVGASGSCIWSYAPATSCSSFQANTCNGVDHDIDSSLAGVQNGLIATGSLGNCHSNLTAGSVFDLSGNAREYTASRSAGVTPMRGGAYNNIAFGLECGYSFLVASDTFEFVNTGFRCCANGATPP
jgi:formylglycine-generating enzyme required for sulfatase activity